MNSGTFESEIHKNKQTRLIIYKIYEYLYRLLGKIPIKALFSNKNTYKSIKMLGRLLITIRNK